jgi:hypothetical protein
MARARGVGAIVLERRMDRVFEDFRHRQNSHDMAVHVPNFDAGFTEWGTVIHELPHQIARAIFGFRQCVFKVRKLCAFLIASHAAFIAKIYEIPGHSAVQFNQPFLTLDRTCRS